MKHSQEEINKIWDDAKNKKYAGSSPEHQPVILSDDESEQCLSIPSEDGSSR